MPDSATYRTFGSFRAATPPAPAASSSAIVATPAAAGASDSTAAASPALPSADTSAVADTLALPWGRCQAAPDSLADAFRAGDTLVRWREAAPETVYGLRSERADAPPFRAEARGSLVATVSFEGAVLLLAGLYVMLLYRNLGDVRSLLSRISRDAASSERLAEDPGRSGFARFLHVTTAIGLLFVGLAAVKGADELLPPARSARFAPELLLALPLLSTALCAVVVLFRAALLRLAGAVTRTQATVSQLLSVGRIYLALAVVVVVPALALYALCPRGEGNVWLCLVAGGIAVTYMLYLRETLHLFLGKKISILHWFLYLCTVEIFPVSFVWLLLAR